MNDVSHDDEQDSVISSDIEDIDDTDDTRAEATRTALGEPALSGSRASLYGRVAALAGVAMVVAIPLGVAVSAILPGDPSTTVTFVI